MKLSEKLRELRKKMGLTQNDVAVQIGVSRVGYTQYELGKREPDYEILKKIAKIFNVSLDYLLGMTEMLSPQELIIPDELKNVRVAFHRGAFEDLTQDEVDKIAEFARFVKAQRKGK